MKKIILFFIITQSLFSQSKFTLTCNSSLIRESEKIALEQIGTTEATNRNDGPAFEIYLRTAGLPKGSAYCAAGQYYCYFTACRRLNLSMTEIPFPKTGLANKIFEHAAKKGKRSAYYSKRHDFIVWRNGNTPFGHIERVYKTGKAGWVRTIAFNTKSGNKEGVFLKNRNIYHPLSRMKIRGIVGFEGS